MWSSASSAGEPSRLPRGETQGRWPATRGRTIDVLWHGIAPRLAQGESGVRGQAVADTAPPNDFARLAGMGWIGKNTMLINRKLGSFAAGGALVDPGCIAIRICRATAERVPDASTPVRLAFVGPKSSMTVHQLLDDRHKGPSPRRWPTSWMVRSSDAAFARTSVPGTKR